MENPPPTRRKKVTSGIVYLSILVLGAAGGIGLAYPLRPQPPLRAQLTYEVMIFKANAPIADFSQLKATMNSAGYMTMAGHMYFRARAPYDPPIGQKKPAWKLRLITISNNASHLSMEEKLQIDVEGMELGKKVVTDLSYRKDGRHTKHHFVSDEQQIQILVLDQGSEVTYAMVRFSRTTLPPGGSPTFPARRVNPGIKL